jgi:hypoxanthine-DNA glycosylase
MAEHERLNGFEPVITAHCRAVVLGSFPGKTSLDAGHYYAHPRNLFWPIVSEVLDVSFVEMPFEQRYEQLTKAGIGLWDVIANCRRPGSLDSDIRDAQPAQLAELKLVAPDLSVVLLNGKKAQQGARQAHWDKSIELIDLPSTSPANASISRETKTQLWRAAILRAMK